MRSFQTNTPVRAFAGNLQRNLNSGINPREIADQYRSHPKYSGSRGFQVDSYERKFLTIFTKQAIKKTGEECPGLMLEDVEIPSRKTYHWAVDFLKTYFAYQRRPKKSVREENPIMQFESLFNISPQKTPVIIESSLYGGRKIKKSLLEGKFDKKIELIEKQFSKHPCYILIAPESIKDSDYEFELQNYNGVILTLPFTRKEFSKLTRKIIRDYNFKSKGRAPVQVSL